MASKRESLSYSGSSWRFPRERFSNLLRHSKEIYRGHLLDVIRQEGPPCLRRRIPASAQILAHGRRGNRECEVLPTGSSHGPFVQSNRESRQRGLVFPDGGVSCASNSRQTPSDANGGLYPASGCAASAASPARNGTSKSTAGGPIAEGGDDVARFVAGRRSDGGGQRSQPAERRGSET